MAITAGREMEKLHEFDSGSLLPDVWGCSTVFSFWGSVANWELSTKNKRFLHRRTLLTKTGLLLLLLLFFRSFLHNPLNQNGVAGEGNRSLRP